MQCEKDNENDNALLQESHIPSLFSGITRMHDNPNKTYLLDATMSEDEHSHLKCRAIVDTWCMDVSNSIPAKENVEIGLDLEWSIHDRTSSATRLLQISFPEDKAVVINLSLMNFFRK